MFFTFRSKKQSLGLKNQLLGLKLKSQINNRQGDFY